MEEPTYLLIFLCFLLFVWYVKSRLGSQSQNLPPGPTNWPFIGSIPALITRKGNSWKKLSGLSKKYGDIYCVHIGTTPVIVLTGYQTIYEAFVKHAHEFSDRPNWLYTVEFTLRFGRGVVWNNGREWKSLRRFGLHALRDLGMGKASTEEKIMEEVNGLASIIAEQEGQAIFLKPFLAKAASNVICSLVFDKRFEFDDHTFNDILDLLHEVFSGEGPLGVVNFMPCLRFFPPFRQMLQRYKNVVLMLITFVENIIQEHEETFDPNNIRDLCDLYLKNKQDKIDPDIFTDSNMFRLILDLFSSGSETIATTLDWTFLYMINYPNVQRKCQAEIDRVVGSSRSVRLSDKSSLPYIEATIMEIQRHGNVAPHGLPHSVSMETTFRGYTIPESAIITMNMDSSMMDPEYWTEPEMFLPERFLDEDMRIKRIDAFIPFSVGPRSCPGESLAKTELFLICATFLQMFDFRQAGPTLPSLIGDHGITRTPVPYEVRVFRR